MSRRVRVGVRRRRLEDTARWGEGPEAYRVQPAIVPDREWTTQFPQRPGSLRRTPGTAGWHDEQHGHPWYNIVVDSRDHHALARWWAQVLDWKIVYEDAEETSIALEEGAEPGLTFVAVPEEKTVKNRLHIDLAPDDQDTEVQRLLAMGAVPADVGQPGDVSWVVLRDPEGNEFCVLSAR